MKIGICGHYGGKEQFFDGQTIKTKNVTKALGQKFGKDNIVCVDTYKIKKRFIPVFWGTVVAFFKCDACIMLPAHNGIKVFTPLFSFLSKLFKKKIYYIVIGGWLASYLSDKEKIANKLKDFDGIFVETKTMKKNLESIGFNNIYILPNFKDLEVLSPDELVYDHQEPYKLCIFSRIMKEKGIEDAVDAVNEVNRIIGRTAFTLDIYGQIDSSYKESFSMIMNHFPSYVSYKGTVSCDQSVSVLKNYFLLLFPTYYDGEGFAGTIIDALASGLPILATDWKYNSEIVDDSVGFLYETHDLNALINILIDISNNKIDVESKRVECVKKAHDYTLQSAMEIISCYIG